MRIPLNPTLIDFPIYWFSIVIPLAIAAIGGMGDAVNPRPGGELVVSFPSSTAFLLSILKNVNLSFVSTDLWALTTVVVSAAKGSLHAVRVWALSLGMILGLLFHLLSYLFITITVTFEWALGTASLVVVIGFIGLLLMRNTVFERIEMLQMKELWEAKA